MGQIRPRNMTQQEFATMLFMAGFTSCTKTAVSLAERSKETGVQFTPEARKAAQSQLNSTRREENRKNGRSTTVWLDDETRTWCETRAYMEGISVGELIRKILWTEIVRETVREVRQDTKNAAPDVAASEAAKETEESGKPSISDHNS